MSMGSTPTHKSAETMHGEEQSEREHSSPAMAGDMERLIALRGGSCVLSFVGFPCPEGGMAGAWHLGAPRGGASGPKLRFIGLHVSRLGQDWGSH